MNNLFQTDVAIKKKKHRYEEGEVLALYKNQRQGIVFDHL